MPDDTEKVPDEQLVNPGQYKQALRSARERWARQLADLQVDLDLALSDADTTPEQAAQARDQLGPGIRSAQNRIREIDRRLELSDEREKELMGVHRPELSVVPPVEEEKGAEE